MSERPMPTFDDEGYPSDDTLGLIKSWPFGDFPALVEFIKEAWSDYGAVDTSTGLGILDDPVMKVRCVTGGWSGNESIIGALQENRPFWWTCWEQTHRGGFFAFEVPLSEQEGMR